MVKKPTLFGSRWEALRQNPIDKFTRFHYPEDKRTLRICLPDKGISLKPRLTTERDQANQECLDGLTVEEKVLLRNVSYTK